MKLLENYIDYQLDIILEAIRNDESMLVLSDRLMSIISYIDSPITRKFFEYNNNIYSKSKITLLDINDKKNDNGEDILDSISFLQSNKIYDYIATNKITDLNYDRRSGELTGMQHNYYNNYLRKYKDDLFSVRGRSETSLGRIINKLFVDEFNNTEIETFVNKYKSLREKPVFELVEGDDIVYWYDEENYVKGEGTLNNSCMRYSKKSDFIKFYSINKNKVSLLILKDSDDKDKIKGRALVWKLDEPEGKVYMDRIYTTIDYLQNHFINYAKEKGWIYKSEQNMYETTALIDTETGEFLNKISVNDIKEYDKYPYMDTLKFYNNQEGILSNYIIDSEYSTFKLDSTDGNYYIITPEGDRLYWSNYYGENLSLDNDDLSWCDWIGDYRYYDDCYWSEYYDVSIDYEYRNANMVECIYNNDDWDQYRKPEDTVKMHDGEFATTDWAKSNGVKDSEYLGGGVSGAVWSKYYNSYIGDTDDKSVIDVRLEPSKEQRTEEDWRFEDDDTYYEYGGYYFDNNVKKEDIE